MYMYIPSYSGFVCTAILLTTASAHLLSFVNYNNIIALAALLTNSKISNFKPFHLRIINSIHVEFLNLQRVHVSKGRVNLVALRLGVAVSNYMYVHIKVEYVSTNHTDKSQTCSKANHLTLFLKILKGICVCVPE